MTIENAAIGILSATLWRVRISEGVGLLESMNVSLISSASPLSLSTSCSVDRRLYVPRSPLSRSDVLSTEVPGLSRGM